MGVRRPWNIVDMPVYSLATTNTDGTVNMNICTYVSAISMKPKLFMVAVDYHTQTFKNLLERNQAILQILHKEHHTLVPTLGKKSGANYDKGAYLRKKNLLADWNGHEVLANVCGLMQLELRGRMNVQGDHELFWFEVVKSKTIDENNLLMFQDLIAAGTIL